MKLENAVKNAAINEQFEVWMRKFCSHHGISLQGDYFSEILPMMKEAFKAGRKSTKRVSE